MSPVKTILVFGKTGQVAQALARLALPVGAELKFAGQAQCDLLLNDPKDLIGEVRPAGVINAAAYTAVDKAENEPKAAFRLNRDAAASMAQACADANIPFAHISTDYVFDGSKVEPYSENDLRKPISVYGESKAAGEEAIEAAGGHWTILRTAWVFSPLAPTLSRACSGWPIVMRYLSSPTNMVDRRLQRISPTWRSRPFIGAGRATDGCRDCFILPVRTMLFGRM